MIVGILALVLGADLSPDARFKVDHEFMSVRVHAGNKLGSGLVVQSSPVLIVATAYHVIVHEKNIWLDAPQNLGTRLDVDKIATFAESDVAFIRTTWTDGWKQTASLIPPAIHDEDTVRLMGWGNEYGNALFAKPFLVGTSGIPFSTVANHYGLHTDAGFSVVTLYHETILSGDSGGPVFDADGHPFALATATLQSKEHPETTSQIATLPPVLFPEDSGYRDVAEATKESGPFVSGGRVLDPRVLVLRSLYALSSQTQADLSGSRRPSARGEPMTRPPSEKGSAPTCEQYILSVLSGATRTDDQPLSVACGRLLTKVVAIQDAAYADQYAADALTSLADEPLDAGTVDPDALLLASRMLRPSALPTEGLTSGPLADAASREARSVKALQDLAASWALIEPSQPLTLSAAERRNSVAELLAERDSLLNAASDTPGAPVSGFHWAQMLTDASDVPGVALASFVALLVLLDVLRGAALESKLEIQTGSRKEDARLGRLLKRYSLPGRSSPLTVGKWLVRFSHSVGWVLPATFFLAGSVGSLVLLTKHQEVPKAPVLALEPDLEQSAGKAVFAAQLKNNGNALANRVTVEFLARPSDSSKGAPLVKTVGPLSLAPGGTKEIRFEALSLPEGWKGDVASVQVRAHYITEVGRNCEGRETDTKQGLPCSGPSVTELMAVH